jgi:hypothetical protein
VLLRTCRWFQSASDDKTVPIVLWNEAVSVSSCSGLWAAVVVGSRVEPTPPESAHFVLVHFRLWSKREALFVNVAAFSLSWVATKTHCEHNLLAVFVVLVVLYTACTLHVDNGSVPCLFGSGRAPPGSSQSGASSTHALDNDSSV